MSRSLLLACILGAAIYLATQQSAAPANGVSMDDRLERIQDAGSARVGDAGTKKTIPSGSSTVTVITEQPAALAASASLDVDVYSLARMIASEEASGTPATLLTLAECARNYAAWVGKTMTALLTHSTITAADGLYGEQAGRWASTARAPGARHVEAAKIAVLEGSNFAAGALDFFDPSTQDRGMQAGKQLRKTSEQYIDGQAQEGHYWVGPLPDVDAYHLMAFAPNASGSTQPALDLLAQRRPKGSNA